MTTTKMTTFARPYATAAFNFAKAENVLENWHNFLQNAKLVVVDPQVGQLMNRPGVDPKALVKLFSDVLNKVGISVQQKNFLKLLVVNKRLPLLPDIEELYSKFFAAFNKEITVTVTSAKPLDEIYLQKLSDKLTERFQQKVSLQCEVDKKLIGGAVIRTGDRVIDGSVRGKLDRLLESF